MPNRKRGVQGSGIFKANPGGIHPQVDSLQCFPRCVAPDSLEMLPAFGGSPERVHWQLHLHLCFGYRVVALFEHDREQGRVVWRGEIGRVGGVCPNDLVVFILEML